MGRWQQRNLVHGEGDQLGDPVRLAMHQWYVLNRMFEYEPVTGQLLYDRVLIIIAKGNGKTEDVGRMVVSDLVGPIAPISPRIVLAAASYDQANESFTASRLSIVGDGEEKAGPLYPFFRDADHLLEDRIINPEGHGEIVRIAAVGGTSDGGKPTRFVGDEIHEWLTERQERVWVVQGKSIRKRKVIRRTPASLGLPPDVRLHGGQQVGITTIGASRDSLLGRLYEHGVKVATGEVHDPSFLFICWQADEAWDLDDPEQLDQAILEANPAVGEWLTLENKRASARDTTVPFVEFLRYDLSRWPDAELRWIPDQAWAATEGAVEFDQALPVFVAVNFAHDHRTASVAMAQLQDQAVLVRQRTFPDEPLPLGQYVEVSAIEAHLRALRKAYPALVWTVRKPNPRMAEQKLVVPGPEVAHNGLYLEGLAQKLRAEGWAMTAVTDGPAFLGDAAATFKAVVEGSSNVATLRHEADPVLAVHVADIVAKETPRGWMPTPAGDRPITAARAAMHAVHRALTIPKVPRPATTADSNMPMGF